VPRQNLIVADIQHAGFMTFAPEWLSGNQNLDGSNFMFLWVYLVFFNMLWVVLPLFALWYSFWDICNAFSIRNAVMKASLRLEEKASEAREAKEVKETTKEAKGGKGPKGSKKA
jgi:hypothetical protein